MKNYYIIGCGGLAKEVYTLTSQTLANSNYFKGFIDLDNSNEVIIIGNENFPIINQVEFLKRTTPSKKIELYIGVGNPIIIDKTSEVIDIIKKVSEKGFSPSSLTNYIRNPIDFYYQKILNIKEYDDAEETVASNTLGTVIHNTLEDFYKPFVGALLTIDAIKGLKSQIEQTVTYHFKNEYKEGDITKGKNLIIFEIAKRYVSNFLDLEITSLKAGDKIKIIAIESDNTISIKISELNFPIKIKGKVDRVDECNGIIRIIDYKTGNVQQNQVEIVNWEDITTDYKKYSKSFQVLTYAYVMQKSNKINLPIEAGIISFKNLSSGFLKFSKKESTFSRSKNSLVTDDTLIDFEAELKKLILEICNPKIDFTEKEV